ncbi:DUF866-domain-containing protein [Aureobasidium pullulans]|uniref:DUF866-domain-containing protein n=1 Tax=Aureobasidium pullulans TaxID=5580 RepID=A0A4S9A8N0_AURPU|nr:DUF866-domain-containing protein [Aureobasidium pullulans]
MLALTLTAELNGVTDLAPIDTEDSPFYYTFKVQCTSCREVHPNWVSVSRFEQNEVSGSRGEANFVWKCKNCKVGLLTWLFRRPRVLTQPQREHSATIKEAPKAYAQNDTPKSQKIIEIDCRGLEFVEFKPDGEWKATGIDSNTKFDAIDLTEGDWYDYDEKASEEVSIQGQKWEIKRA